MKEYRLVEKVFGNGTKQYAIQEERFFSGHGLVFQGFHWYDIATYTNEADAREELKLRRGKEIVQVNVLPT